MFQSQKAHKLRPKVWKKFRRTPFMYDSRLENKFIRPKMKLIKEQWTIPHTHTHTALTWCWRTIILFQCRNKILMPQIW